MFFQQAEIVIRSDCVHGGRNSIRIRGYITSYLYVLSLLIPHPNPTFQLVSR